LIHHFAANPRGIAAPRVVILILKEGGSASRRFAAVSWLGHRSDGALEHAYVLATVLATRLRLAVSQRQLPVLIRCQTKSAPQKPIRKHETAITSSFIRSYPVASRLVA
jgi:hypothetical protein